MIQTKKYKVALVGQKHSNGGAERVLSDLSFALDELGYEVHVIITMDEVSYPYAGKLFNIGTLRNSSNSFLNKVKRFFALRKYIRKEKFDVLIDFRNRVGNYQEIMIYKLAYNNVPIKIQTVHLAKYTNYLFEKKWISNFIFKKFDSIICISEKQQEIIQNDLGFTNLSLIYNPININEIQLLKEEKLDINYKYIVAIGRYTSVKQFDKLIPAYSESDLPKQDIHLLILGQGEDKNLLEKVKSESEYSSKIHLMDFQNNPFKYINNSLFLIKSSSVEGLPMVLLESLACGIPVVSFDCPTGPSEIIINNTNGILVENQNFEELIQSMNKMINDSDFYENCKSNALDSVRKFDVSVIKKQWQILIEKLIDKKQI